MSSRLPRLSIFPQIALAFVISCLLLAGLVFGLMPWLIDPNDTQRLTQDKNRFYYSEYLIDQIGMPPKLEQANKLADQLGIKINIAGPDIEYSSCTDFPQGISKERQTHSCAWDSSARIGRFGHQILTIVDRNGYQFTFLFRADPFAEGRWEIVPFFLFCIVFILLGVYLFVRKLLSPLRELMVAVERISEGDLNYQIQVKQDDELGRLSRAFNQMTLKVREMIRSKEQLLLDVSHELRSPLTRMKVALELDSDLLVERLSKSIRELEGMVHELLESARMESAHGKTQMVETSALALIELAIAATSQPQRCRILSLSTFSRDRMLLADPNQARSVLKNVIENGLKYSPLDQQVEISVQDAEDKDQIWIEIRDYGSGIPAEEQALVFEPFYRVDKSRSKSTGGYGLGLSLCKKIMTAHEGEIWISPTQGNGTTFIVAFKKGSGGS